MPSRQLPTSLAVARFLKERRKGLGYTLRQVAELSESDGKLIPLSTLARIEQGKLDPGLPRLQQLLRLYSVPTQIAGDLLDLEELSGDVPDETSPGRLLEMARKASQRQDYRAAIGIYLALTQLGEAMDRLQRQQAVLGLAGSAAQLGKFQFSKYVLDRLLLEPPDPVLIVPVLVLVSRCWQRLKGHEAALAFIDRAASHLTRRTEPGERASVFHQRARLLSELKRFREADEVLEQALKEYRRAKDDSGYSEALASRVQLRFDLGRPGDALLAAQAARLFAQRHRLERQRLSSLLAEAKADFLLGRESACLKRLGSILGDAAVSADATILFHLHYYYWRIYEQRGDSVRARLEFDTMVHHLGALDESTEESAQVQKLIAARPSGKGRQP